MYYPPGLTFEQKKLYEDSLSPAQWFRIITEESRGLDMHVIRGEFDGYEKGELVWRLILTDMIDMGEIWVSKRVYYRTAGMMPTYSVTHRRHGYWEIYKNLDTEKRDRYDRRAIASTVRGMVLE